MEDIERLKRFLAKDEMNIMHLAIQLGYTSAAPIQQWIRRKDLPKFRAKEILRTISEFEKKRKK